MSATTVAGQEEARPVPSVPSGSDVTLQEWLAETDPGLGDVARFRFVVPAIGQGAGFDVVEADFPVLCGDFALPVLSEAQITPERIVISFADRPVDFGTTDPDVIQFFEVFRVENGTCIWEGF